VPIPGATYRFKKGKKGKSVRLAFVKGKAVEATPFKKNTKGILKKSGSPSMVSMAKKAFGI
jgi:hypothetical protein